MQSVFLNGFENCRVPGIIFRYTVKMSVLSGAQSCGKHTYYSTPIILNLPYASIQQVRTFVSWVVIVIFELFKKMLLHSHWPCSIEQY